jgi:hypothetical protein
MTEREAPTLTITPQKTGCGRQRWDVATAQRSTLDRGRAWSGRHAERPAVDDSTEVDDTMHRIEAARDSDQQTETRPVPASEAAAARRRPEGGA